MNICPLCQSSLTPGDPCGCEALKISELEATVRGLWTVNERLVTENAELKDVVAELTEELARRTAEMELVNV